MSTAYAGTEGNVKIGAVDADVNGWSADVTVNTFDSTTTADGGWDDETASTKRVEGSFTFFYNATKKPTGSMGLTPGSVVTLNLYINLTAAELLTGLALIKKLSFGVKTKDGVLVTCSFTNKGPWTLPS